MQVLRDDRSIAHVIGMARRLPPPGTLDIEWRQVNVATDDLRGHFQGIDAVIHLAWLVQPSRNPAFLHDVNVLGSARVFDAVAEAGVGALLYASAGSAYSPISTREAVDEAWPTNGVPTSMFSRQKAYVERLLDRFELAHPLVRVVRLRPGITVKREAASEIQRLLLGKHMVALATKFGRRSLLPYVPGMAIQAVHTEDVAEAYRSAVLGSVAGAFNVAAEPVDAGDLAQRFELHSFPVGARFTRAMAMLAWHLGVSPAEPGWLDLLRQTPVLDSSLARKELGWSPRVSASAALAELAAGLASRSSYPTPPLCS
jgi:nucleoside-diphosphate-sugar epimerase